MIDILNPFVVGEYINSHVDHYSRETRRLFLLTVFLIIAGIIGNIKADMRNR